MLLTSGGPPAGEDWAAEVKWDGIRAQVRLDRGRLTVRSRRGRDCTQDFPEQFAASVRRHRLLLDGELVCLAPDGAPDFAALRRRLIGSRRRGQLVPASLIIFDVLHADGRAVRSLPYRARRELLGELGLDGPSWRTPECFVGEALELAGATAELGLEGIVAKRLDSPYVSGRRSCAWIKTKHRRREDLVVTAVREATATRGPELLVARRSADGMLTPAGAVAMGVTAEVIAAFQLAGTSRRGIARLRAPVAVAVDCHGRPDGPVRDAVLRGLVPNGVSTTLAM